MKKSVFIVLAFISLTAYAQNKTLGVGVTSPNPNAALHVESPTGNQGFIMPRLTTVQRTGMGALLTASDNGLMLYDTDLKTIYIWDGSSWKSTAQVAGGSKLSYPYKDSVATNPGTTDLFALKYAGTDNTRVMRIENRNATNGSSTLSVASLGTGLAGYFQVNNATSGGTALYGTTNSNLGGTIAPVGVYGESTGTGSLGGAFWNTNAANTWPALYSRTLGVGNAARFEILNTGNSAPALVAETNGTGNAIQTSGKIQAGQFIGSSSTTTRNFSGKSVTRTTGTDTLSYVEVNNPASIYPAVLARSNSDGGAGAFIASNPTTGAAGLYVESQGSGPALDVYTTGNGNVAGRFIIDNVSSNGPIIQATTVGTGPGIELSLNTASAFPGILITKAGGIGNAIEANRPIQATQFIGDGSGLTNLPAVSFPFSTSLNNVSTLFDITNTGTGKAGNFSINNASNADNTLRVTTNGTGDNGWFEVTNASSTGSAVVALSNSLGATVFSTNSNGTTGAAGYFGNTNPAGTSSALTGSTNSNAGGAVAPVGVYGVSTGTGSLGGAFRVNNVANDYPALYAETNGTGSTIFAKQIGTTTGNAGYFEVSNVNNPATGVYGKTYGTGNAVGGLTTGTGTAGRFEISNSVNTQTALEALTDGTGSAFSATNNGTGFGVYARAVGPTDAVYAEKQATDAAGSAGNFWNKNAGNGASALFAATNASTGTALGLINSANGNALALFQGGMKLSTAAPLTSGGDITTRAFAYLISDATLPYTFPAGFLSNGDIFYFYNEDGLNNATIDGTIVIPSNSGALVIYLGGTLRAIYGGVAP